MQDLNQIKTNLGEVDNGIEKVTKIKLVRTLGKGVSGTVKLGINTEDQTKLAVKIFKDSTDQQFESEVQSLK